MAISEKNFQAAWIISLCFYSALAVAQPRQKITDFSGKWGGHFTFCYYNKKNKVFYYFYYFFTSCFYDILWLRTDEYKVPLI